MIGRYLMAGFLAGMPFAGAAQEVDCANAQTQIEMTFCAEQDWNAADAELNDAYRLAMAAMKQIDENLGAGDHAAEGYLRQAQRDWVAFRDNACAAEAYPMHGGSAEPMIIYYCRARLTEERTVGLSYIGSEDDAN